MNNSEIKTNVLILGIGGTGSHAVDLLYSKIESIGQLSHTRVKAIVFDTDEGDLGKIQNATVIPLADHCSVGTVVDKFDSEILEDWFPCYCGEEAQRRDKHDGQNYRNQDMATGANQWRKKSYLAFVNLMNDDRRRTRFENAMREMVAEGGQDGLYEIFTVASIAGGTGSGSFIPVTLYAKKFLREQCHVEARTHAMLACPDIYISHLHDESQETKVYANAYAILKELNAMNQVAFGYNKQVRSGDHKAPINFRLGHKNDRNIGVLFDSADEAYWDTIHVPFNKIYLLDRMNGLNSVSAHDNVMASALYSLICTDIGLAFKTRDNNLATAQSEADRRNSVYASIAASELVYPVESIVDYLAHKQASVSVEGDWLTIYRETEAAIAEKKLMAQEAGVPYVQANGAYALEIENTLKNERNTPTGKVTDIVDRGIQNTEEVDGKVVKTDRIPEYLDRLYANFRERLNCNEAQELVGAITANSESFHQDLPSLGLFAGSDKKKANRLDFIERAKGYNDLMIGYYRNAVQVIRNQRRSLVKNILGLGLEEPVANKELSMVYNLFMKDGKYIHPVAAFVLLANLKTKIHEEIKNFKPWADATSFTDIGNLTLPAKFYQLDGSPDSKKNASAYTGPDRFSKIVNDAEDAYADVNSNDPGEDSKKLRTDIVRMQSALFADAHKQIIGIVLTEVEKTIDSLLEEYRGFFATFTEGKKSLLIKTERLLHSDDDTPELVVVGASAEDKEAAYKAYNKNQDVSEESIRELDHITGEAVFSIAYGAASAKAGNGVAKAIEVDGLFTAIVAAYKKEIKSSKFYATMASKNAFQVLVEYYTSRGDSMADSVKKIGALITKTLDKAIPSLHVKKAKEDSAILIHESLGKYLVENAKEFYLPTNMTKAEDFIGEFLSRAGVTSAFRLAETTPPGTIYVTRKVDAIMPTDIEKLNEVGSGAIYFKNYQKAISKMYSTETDMWNPHLGMEYHKHGFLPYINEEMEEEYNKKLAKAVLYTILEGLVTFKALPRNPSQRVFWYTENGSSRIMYHKKQMVSEKNLAGLVGWLRQRDELVEERSEAFDKRVRDGLRALPLLIGSTQNLTRRITEDEKVIKPMRENLFVNVPGAQGCKELSLGLIEFAYKVKTSEEADRDCDDGEKILKEGFNALQMFCFEQISEDDVEGRIDVYTQQLRKFIAEFVFDDDTQGFSKNPDEVVEFCKIVLDWANKNDCFYALDYEGNHQAVSLGEFLKTPEAANAKRAYDERHRPISFDDVPTATDSAE